MNEEGKPLTINVTISAYSAYQLKMWKAMRGHKNMNAALDDFIMYHVYQNPLHTRSWEKFDGTYRFDRTSGNFPKE